MASIKGGDFRVSRLDGDFGVSTEEKEALMKSEGFDSNETGDSDDIEEIDEDVVDDDSKNFSIDSGIETDDFDPSGTGEPGTELCQFENQSFSIPIELYDLDSLRSILSVETWNEFLSDEEQFKLAQFLPDMDQETFGRTLAELFLGKNFHFGSPLGVFFNQLKGGLCEPSVALYRSGLKFLRRREYSHRLYEYHNSMTRSLAQIGDVWQSCAGYDIGEKIQVLHMWKSKVPQGDAKVGNIGSETDLEIGGSNRDWSKWFKADIMNQNSKGLLKVNASKLPVQEFAGKSFQHGIDLKRKHEIPHFPFSRHDQVARYDTGDAAAKKARHSTAGDLNDSENRYEMSLGEWTAGLVNELPRNSLLSIKKKKSKQKYAKVVEDSAHTESYAASTYHQGKRKFIDKAVTAIAYSNSSLSGSKKSKYPENYGMDYARDRVKSSPLRETLFQHSAGSKPTKHPERHQVDSLLDYSVKSGNGHGKGKKWRSQYEHQTYNAGYDTKAEPHKTVAGLDDSYFQTDMQPRMSQKKLKNKSIQYDLIGTNYSGFDIMRAQNDETESDSSDQIKHEDAWHARKLGHHRGEVEGYQSRVLKAELEPNKAKDRIMYKNNYSYYHDAGTDLNYSEADAYSTKSKKKGKKNESKYLHDSLHNSSSRAYSTEKRHRAMVDLDQCPQQLYARDNNYNGSLLDDYMDTAEGSTKLLGSMTQSNKFRNRMEVADAQAIKVTDEMSSMPLIGCNSSTKKAKWKVDGRYPDNPDESIYSNQQFDDPMKKKGKRKSDVGLDALAAVLSDSLIPEKGIADVEPELKLQRKPFTLITPTIHSGFSFSIVHLLTAVRKAMTTPNVEDITMTGSHLEKTDGLSKLKMVDTETHQTTNVAHLSKSLDNDTQTAEPALNSHIPSRTVQEIVDRVRSNPGDPCILETQEPLQDLIRGTLKIFSSRTAPLGAKGWKPLVMYESSNKSWSWVGPVSTSSPDYDIADEENSPEAWGVPHKMLVKMVDAFANWLKSGQDTLKQIGSLPAPPASLFANLDEKERFKDLRAQKSLNTISPSTDEVREYFRKEEFLRYSIPDRAFSYTAADGKKSIVAPLRRGGGKPTSKARDHFMLKPDRPPHVTILCLVRDAAARLPGSYGTRADVCTLIRDSQYTVETVTDAQVNQVVSGALDRLHYERDPCVQFDSEKKIWKYLHRDREEEDFEDDGTSSTKKWKRQRKDATDQSDAGLPNDSGTLNDAGTLNDVETLNDTADVIAATAANGSSAGLDDEHDLNIDVSSSKADEETEQIHDKSAHAEDVDSFVDCNRNERRHWGFLD